MGQRYLVASIAGAVIVPAVVLVWLISPAHGGQPPAGAFEPAHYVHPLKLSGREGLLRRQELLHRASFHHDGQRPVWPRLDSCQFVPTEPSGTTPKFDCAFPGGVVLKVKYGRNAERHAEVAATRLLGALGYAADHVRFVEHLRCYGCPRHPFVTMQLASRARTFGLPAPAGDHGFTDFSWVAVEQKLDAMEVETTTVEGWSWWELAQSPAPRADLDAFKLLAVFLAHWDNKGSNQRLACLDEACERPVALMQDVGATFGPTKVNLARWNDLPIWAVREECLVSMRHLPFQGATFPDAKISEAGRAQLAAKLNALSDGTVREIFAEARFPEFQSSTDDARDLGAWTAAFRHRANQITAHSCPPG